MVHVGLGGVVEDGYGVLGLVIQACFLRVLELGAAFLAESSLDEASSGLGINSSF